MKLAFRLAAYGTSLILLFGGLVALAQYLPNGLRLAVATELAPTLGTSEFSPVEWLQLAFLAVIVATAWQSVRWEPRQKPLGLLLGAIALAAFVRELDLFLDRYVADNTWQVIIGTLGAVVIAYEVTERQTLLREYRRTMPSVGLVLIFIGITVVVGVATAIGAEALWVSLLGDHYARVAKVAAEELVELLGYFLWTAGQFEFALECRARQSLADGRRRSS
ncbi:MAG: hypothetical protein AAGF46_06660 [Pseudomonadota bacterium]